MQMGRDDRNRVADSGLAKPQTVAQCHEVIDRPSQAPAQTQRPMAEQQSQIAWLQEHVKLDSRTSLKPPSSNAPDSGKPAQRRGGPASAARKRALRAVAGRCSARPQVAPIIDCPGALVRNCWMRTGCCFAGIKPPSPPRPSSPCSGASGEHWSKAPGRRCAVVRPPCASTRSRHEFRKLVIS